MHAFIGYSFFWGGLKYANELCILPKRLDCNFKQTIVHIDYAEGEINVLSSLKQSIKPLLKFLLTVG